MLTACKSFYRLWVVRIRFYDPSNTGAARSQLKQPSMSFMTNNIHTYANITDSDVVVLALSRWLIRNAYPSSWSHIQATKRHQDSGYQVRGEVHTVTTKCTNKQCPSNTSHPLHPILQKIPPRKSSPLDMPYIASTYGTSLTPQKFWTKDSRSVDRGRSFVLPFCPLAITKAPLRGLVRFATRVN